MSNLNLLRVLGIILVVIRHCFAPFTGAWSVSEYYQSSIVTKTLGEYISTISMPLFVFISGFLYCFLKNNLEKYGSYNILLKKKTLRLMVPYFILGPVYIYFFLEYNSIKSFLHHLLKGPGHFWFLLMIFIVFITFYPLESFFKKSIKKGLIIVTILFFLDPIINYMGLSIISRVFKYLPFFYMGYLFNLKSTYIFNYIKEKFWFIFLIHLALFLSIALTENLIENKIILYLINQISILILGILSISFLFILFNNKQINISKNNIIVKTINKNSYYIYILHQPILKSIFLLEFMQNLSIVFSILIAFIISFFSSIIVSEYILKFKFGRLLIGA